MRNESDGLPSMAKRKITQFTMRMDPDVKAAGEQAAADDRRSLSALIEVLLVSYCKEKGLLTEQGRLQKKTRR
jgi:hypothetical protein